MITIKRADNGYVLQYDYNGFCGTCVIEETTYSQLFAIKKLLQEIIKIYGIDGIKYNGQYIKITIEKLVTDESKN